jgi:hypothetical protein
VAGLVSGAGAESRYRYYVPIIPKPANFKQMNAYERQAYFGERVDRLRPHEEMKNTALAYGLLGSLLVGGLGLAGGLSRGSIARGVKAAAGGLVLGAGAGVGLAAWLSPVYFRLFDPFATMVAPVTTHVGIWGGVGLVAGLVYGLAYAGWGGAPRAALGGFLGALVATVLYELTVAFAFPMAIIAEPVPPLRTLRLMAHFAVAVAAALGAALVVAPGRPKAGAVREV